MAAAVALVSVRSVGLELAGRGGLLDLVPGVGMAMAAVVDEDGDPSCDIAGVDDDDDDEEGDKEREVDDTIDAVGTERVGKITFVSLPCPPAAKDSNT